MGLQPLTKQLPHRHHDPVVTVDGTPATPHLDAGSADHQQEADHELVPEVPVGFEVPGVGLAVEVHGDDHRQRVYLVDILVLHLIEPSS